jgi:hypothetical protein
MMLSLYAALLLTAPAADKAQQPQAQNDLAPPVKILAGGKAIDVEVGHAAPCVADLAGDGKLSLLVGQFSGGKLRAYANSGSKTEPRFEKFEYLSPNVPAG